jgi:hypothetical protein
MNRIMVAVILLMSAATASAQSISPVVGEGNKGHTRGEFTVTNTTLVPMLVTIEPRKLLKGADGKIAFEEIGLTANVQLSQMSAKLGPKQSHTFQYDVACPQDCAVAFYAGFTPPKPQAGFTIVTHLPFSLYVCEGKQNPKGCRKHIHQEWGLKD